MQFTQGGKQVRARHMNDAVEGSDATEGLVFYIIEIEHIALLKVDPGVKLPRLSDHLS